MDYPIPESYPCPMCGRELMYEVNGNRYSKAYSVEIRGVYDGGLFYRDVEGCGKAWHRWEGGTSYGARLKGLAQPYIDQVNQAVLEEELNERAAG